MQFNILYNTKSKKMIICSILLFLASLSLAISTLGWFYAYKMSMSGGYTYYYGWKTLGYAGMAMSIPALALSIIIFSVQISSSWFWEKHSSFLLIIWAIIILLLIPALIMGFIALINYNQVWIWKN